MSKKFLYVNSQADYEEKLSFDIDDFISSSAGVVDAGKPIKLDSNGKIASSLLDISLINHSDLNINTSADEHPVYLLHNGTRALTGNLNLGSHKITNLSNGVSSGDAVNVSQLQAVENMIGNLDFQNSVLSVLNTPPVSPTTGDRYLIGQTPTDGWTSYPNNIVEWNGSSWFYTAPNTGMLLSVDNESNTLKLFNGTAWVDKDFENTTASYGLVKSGIDIQLNLISSGGLKVVGGAVGVEPEEFTGEGLVDDGSDHIAIDWSTTFNDAKAIKASDLNSNSAGLGASIIGIEDSNGFTEETDVEGALMELYDLVLNPFTVMLAGASGVSKGDLLYLSGDGVVDKLDISTSEYAIGVAGNTATAGADVTIYRGGYILASILSGQTSGSKVFWNGTSWQSSLPSGSGSYVWQGGIAKNTTDLFIDIRFLKKNAA